MVYRKRFGQHFLVNQGIISNIINAVSPKDNCQLIEIGPGKGALTYHLLKKFDSLWAIELDKDLVSYWQKKNISNLKIIPQDVLNINWEQLSKSVNKKLYIVANLPYNISTPLLFKLFADISYIDGVILMLQKELTERLLADYGNKKYGYLSIISQINFSISKLLTAKAKDFYPEPKVDSAVIKLIPNKNYQLEEKLLSSLKIICRQAFNYRRKKIGNSLSQLISKEQFAKACINENLRPEQLSIEQFILLAKQFILKVF